MNPGLIMSYTKEQANGICECARANNCLQIPKEALGSMKAALLAFPDVLDAWRDAVAKFAR